MIKKTAISCLLPRIVLSSFSHGTKRIKFSSGFANQMSASDLNPICGHHLIPYSCHYIRPIHGATFNEETNFIGQNYYPSPSVRLLMWLPPVWLMVENWQVPWALLSVRSAINRLMKFAYLHVHTFRPLNLWWGRYSQFIPNRLFNLCPHLSQSPFVADLLRLRAHWRIQ